MDIQVWAPDVLSWDGHTFRCALGGGGISAAGHEGDSATPIGSLRRPRVMYRPDRLSPPKCRLPLREIEPGDGWCDAPEDTAYNRLISLPHAASHEVLWRQDHVYDVIVELGYNDSPPVPGLGSAIFLHVAQPNYAPTEGCVALALPDLLRVLEDCDEQTRLCVTPPGV